MSQLPLGNPKIPEGINHKTEHPLKEFVQLFFGVCAGLAVLTFALSLAIQFLAPFIPFSWEKKTLPLVEQFMTLEDSGANSDASAKQALQQLGERLLASSEMMENHPDGRGADIQSTDFSFHLIESEIPNAYASFGGHIFVTAALIEQVSSENGLAMVIAHEIAHVRYRHPIQAASRGAILQLVLYAVLGQSADGFIGSALSGSSLLTLLSFNRDMESQADESALNLISRHYGTYEGADEFFETMAKESDSILWLEFAQTHPHTQRRLKTIHKRILEHSGTGVELTPMPLDLHPVVVE